MSICAVFGINPAFQNDRFNNFMNQTLENMEIPIMFQSDSYEILEGDFYTNSYNSVFTFSSRQDIDDSLIQAMDNLIVGGVFILENGFKRFKETRLNAKIREVFEITPRFSEIRIHGDHLVFINLLY